MDLVLNQLGSQRLTEGIDSVRWKYTVQSVLRVESQSVVALVERRETADEHRDTTTGSNRALLAERLDGTNVEAAAAEAELWLQAAERAPKLIVRLVDFIPVDAQCCVFVYEQHVPVELKAPLSESDLVRVVAQAFCLARICEELGTRVQYRLAASEFSVQGKARGFGPGVLHRIGSKVEEALSRETPTSACVDDKNTVFLLGCLMRELVGEHDALYSKHLLRLQASCLREMPEARPSLDIVERKLCRQIHRWGRASSEAGSTEVRDEIPSTPEASDVSAPARSHDDLEDVLNEWQTGKPRSKEPKHACFDVPYPAATSRAGVSREPSRVNTDSKSTDDDPKARYSLIESDAPHRNPDRVEQITQLAFGTAEESSVPPQCLRALVMETFIYSDTTAIDTVIKTLRRRVLQYSLNSFARLRALYIIHVLLIRGPRNVYDSVATYMDFISLLRSSGQRFLRPDWKRFPVKSAPLGSWIQGLSERLQDAARVIRRDQTNDQTGWLENHDAGGKRSRRQDRNRLERQEMLVERTNALTSAYGAILMSKVDALRLWRDQGTVAKTDVRNQSKRLAMAFALLRISKMAGKLAEELFADRQTLPMHEAIRDELVLEIVFGMASVASVLAPRLSATESEKLCNEFMMNLRQLTRVFAIAIPHYNDRNYEQLARACRSLWSLSQNLNIDQRSVFALVSRRLPEELSIGCGLRAPDSFATLPQVALYVLRATPKETTSTMPEASSIPLVARVDSKKPPPEHSRARSKSTSAVPSLHARATKPPLAAANSPATLPRNLDIDWSTIELVEELGRGSFGTVYKAKYLGYIVAVKVFEIGRSCSQGDQYRNFYSEVRTLCNLDHENILQFIGAGRAPSPPRLFIVTEFMSRGTLFDLLHRRREVLSPLRKKSMALDVCRGMAYLHDRGLMHRDLKSSNLLVDSSYRVKIGDFGLSKSIRYIALCQPMTGNCGTPQYMAPEVLASTPYGAGADVFSFGVLLWELLAEELPYQGMEPMRVIAAVLHMNERPPLNRHWHPDLVQLLRECWDRNPSKRPTFQALVKRLPPIPFPAPTAFDAKETDPRQNQQ
ncbi:hypothetical protein CCYA_CCYA04G1291 [Cyanidiococcus yangmingshanensis]|nr:hypothetical protein CCYA_CCYA04G1291 [Cyanidiococcus yangmingshanensis]